MKFDYDKSNRQFTLSSEVKLPKPISEVFTFFSDPKNLEVLTPPFLKFHVVATEECVMQVGAKINYHLSLHGVQLSWTSVISQWDPPNSFVDEQLKGPYRYWTHLHQFRAEGEATIVSDRVNYSVYGGPIVERVFVRKDLSRIFNFRAEKMKELFK